MIAFNKLTLVACLLSLLPAPVFCDQPVSCLRQQFHDQVWFFHVTPDPEDLNLFEQQEVCTHSIPNKVQIIDRNYNFSMSEKDTWSVLVKSDFTVDARFCKGGDINKCEKQAIGGRWQTVYDQTLIVELENDLRFIGTFRYQIKKNVTNDAKKLSATFNDVDDFMKAQFNSVCNQTMAGFVQNRTHVSTYQKHRIQCMYAHKDWDNIYEQQVNIAQPEKSAASVTNASVQQSSPLTGEELTLLDASQTEKSKGQVHLTTSSKQKNPSQTFAQTVKSAHKVRKQRTASSKVKKGNLFKTFVPSEQTDARIVEVLDNQNQFDWQPNMCMLSTNHPRYNKTHCMSQKDLEMEPNSKENTDITHVSNTTLNQVISQLIKDEKQEKTVFKKNPASGWKKFGEKTDDFISVAKKVQRYRNEYRHPDHIPDHEVPDVFDLRNIEGYDFTGNLRDQGPCGSCYTNSFIQAIEGRMKVKYAHKHLDMPDLSIQFIMTCNYMTEGCNGGWAIFDGFFAEQGGIPTEKCAPYSAKTKNISCADFSQCKPHTRITNSYYVNGYNFDPTELQIRKEILYNGPVTTEFRASDDDFQLYKSGIMVEKVRQPEKDNSANFAQFITGDSIASALASGDEFIQIKTDTTQKNEHNSTKDSAKTKKNSVAIPTPQTLLQTSTSSQVQMAHEPLDHSIYIVGWGHDKEKNMPYWIIRNSYGDTWGMNGDFLVRRGQDDYGVESEITAFEVELAEDEE